MTSSTTLVVDFNGHSDEIRHSQFGAQVVKDGIVDYFKARGLGRPNVDKQHPDIRIATRLHKANWWSLDFSGDSLHRRGYRQRRGRHRCVKTAAAVLYRAGISEQLREADVQFL